MSGNAKAYGLTFYEEFEKIQSEEKRYKLEYDNGYIYYMTPVYPNHDRVKNKIAFHFMSFLGNEGVCDVFTSDVAVVFENENEKIEYQPDIMVCCEPDKFSGSKYKGVPALVVEILSHSTEHRDLGTKRCTYEKFGVPEYWIVNIKDQTIIVYNKNRDGKYMAAISYMPGMDITCFDGLTLAVDDIFRVLK